MRVLNSYLFEANDILSLLLAYMRQVSLPYCPIAKYFNLYYS